MARKEKIYRRMPGRPFSPFYTGSLWQGPDHLLWVESVFFKESYKRFYYNDIQSIVLQRTGTHLIWTFVWGALALLFGAIAFWVPGPPHVSGTFMVIFLAALLMNIIMGPSCSVYLQTAVQRQKILSLKRVRTANKVMTRIKAFVEKQQGVWEKQKSVDAQKAMLNFAPTASVGAPGTSPAGTSEKVPQGPFNPLLHQILFGLFLVMGIFGCIQLLLKSLPLGLMETLMHGAAQIMVIVVLVRWYRHLKGTMIARINWLALVFIVIQTAIGYGLYFAASFQNPEINYHHWAMFKMMFELQMTDHPVALAGNIIYGGGSLLLGVFGLLVVQRQYRNIQ